MKTVYKNTNFDYSKFINFLNEKGVTEKQFHEDIGLSHATILKIKKNACVSTSTLEKMVEAMDFYEPEVKHDIGDAVQYIR